MNESLDPRLEAMLDAVLFGHDEELGTTADSQQAREFERVAALAAAAFAGAQDPPASLATRLQAAGLQFCAQRRQQRATNEQPRGATPRFVTGTQTRTHRSGTLFGFLTGIAAALLLWFVATRPPADTDLSRAREQLLATQNVQRLDWKVGPSPLSGTVHGDVVWSAAKQTGYLTFEGLPPLDPEHRFQLWIVDGDRKDSAPVDGGLFDVRDAGQRTIVPIRAKLPVSKAAAFVVTVEALHGAVVSKQEHVVAIAGL